MANTKKTVTQFIEKSSRVTIRTNQRFALQRLTQWALLLQTLQSIDEWREMSWTQPKLNRELRTPQSTALTRTPLTLNRTLPDIAASLSPRLIIIKLFIFYRLNSDFSFLLKYIKIKTSWNYYIKWSKIFPSYSKFYLIKKLLILYVSKF